MDLHAYQGWLFDPDGVLTKTAEVYAAAWKQAFDGFFDEESKRSGRRFAPFDPVIDYERYVDGEPREDGVRHFLVARHTPLRQVKEVRLAPAAARARSPLRTRQVE